MVKQIMATLTDEEFTLLMEILTHTNFDADETQMFYSLLKKIQPIGYYDDSQYYKE